MAGVALVGAAGGVGVTTVLASDDYPPAQWIPASVANYTSADRPHDYSVDMIVIHDTESLNYNSTIQIFQNPDRQASAHYVISRAGQVTQMVLEKDVAWHAGNWDYNTRAIGIEHEGYADTPGTYTVTEYKASAQLAASICSRWGVPLDRRHVIGHSEVPDPFHPGLYGGDSHHHDPGPYWNWTYYLSLAQGYAAPLPSPPHMPSPVAASGDGSVILSLPGHTCHNPIQSYHVTGQPGNIDLTVPGSMTSTTITGLQNWTKYQFTVTATNSEGSDSGTSNSVIPMPRLGGANISDPDVSSMNQNRLDVVAVGSDNALWHRSWNGTEWAAWESLGGVITGSPSIVASTNRLDVFGRGADGALWHRFWDGSGWHAWERLGGALIRTSGVDATWSGAQLHVFVRGLDSALWHRWWNGSVWQPWESLGGILSADPGAVSWGTDRIDLFVRGDDWSLWHRWWDGTGWQPWERVGGFLTSSPDASSCASGSLDVFARMPDGLWRKHYSAGAFGSWQHVQGDWSNGPGATCRPSTTSIDVMKVGSDKAVWWLELPS
jgi:N-acetylmuramoyl-L-alanine amidase/Fibronectin type III domain